MTNPVLAFSARRRMRSIRTPLLLTIYTLVLSAIALMLIYAPFLQSRLLVSSMWRTVLGYLFLVGFQFMLIVLVAPAMTAGCVSGERERQTLDLLLVTNTGSTSLVLGKLLECFGFLALMVACSMPVLSLVLLVGGASVTQILCSILFLLLTALAALSVGLFCSTLFRRTVTSTVVSYLVVLGIGLITLLPIWYDVKRIGDTYDAINVAGATLTTIEYTPITFTLNPGLGLFALLQSQTGLFPSDFLYGVSYTLGNTFWLLPFDTYWKCNALFIAALSALLILLSALNVRKQGKRIKRRKA